ncbi:tyrosine-protein phosphatase non-receptor type 6 [Elysia marginata]|uniref:Tyrosine-protein phosphatase non-receptor type 6 n=1 Tax=Elysia marginata TaxID=1093978 RepID=A0AAV4JGV0_9GAST|nr:tyrosine-protein phosphatase non-receptor type 6 [Elysia marginata]
MLSQLLVRTRPHVTWTPRTSQSLYTFIMYDTSFFILHAFYINCPGGSLDGCEEVDAWHGSGNGMPINNPYSFLVYEQRARIPLDDAKKAEQETVEAGRFGTSSPLGVFFITILLQKLNAYVDPEIKFASIMEMYADAYGSFQFTNFFSSGDLCPLYYSQLPEFRWVVQAIQIPNLKWSSPAFGYSLSAVAPHLTSITVHVHVTYETESMTDTACCEQFQITRGFHTVSALDSRPVTAAMTRHAPKVFLSPVVFTMPDGGRGALGAIPYTLVVLDVSPVGNFYSGVTKLAVHWLLANIFESDFLSGTEVVPYVPPTPRDTGSPVTLMFLLFAQSGPVNPGSFNQLCPLGLTMCRLRVTDLISTWSLGDIVGVNWLRSQEDGYSIKRQYTEMGRTERNVCLGRAGYASPCPAQQPCSAIGQLGFRQPYLIGQLATAVLVLYYYSRA